MPTAVSETDTFPQVIQRPNNGELADSASVAQFADAFGKRTRRNYNRSRSVLFDITRAPYNADPTGAADSTTAIQNAINDAAAAGGDVFCPPGVFQRGTLTIPAGVSLRGVPSVTYFVHNHATTNGLAFTGSDSGSPRVISDIHFLGSIVGNGSSIVNNAGARVVFRRCTWNGTDQAGSPSANLQGKLASINAAASRLTFIDCDLNVAGILKGLHAQQGKIRVVRGSMSMPATYAEALAQNDAGGSVTLRDVLVDLTAHVTGVAYVLYANSNDVADFAALRDCEIDATGATGTLTAFQWTPDARVVMWGNKLSISGVAPFGANSAPHARSLVELREYIQQDFSTSASIDLRNSYGYRTHLVRNDASSVSIILPAGVIDGQELDFIYYNAGATGVTPAFATTPLTGTTVPTVGAGNTLTGHFRWAKREASGDSDRWIQVGTWGVGLTLV